MFDIFETMAWLAAGILVVTSPFIIVQIIEKRANVAYKKEINKHISCNSLKLANIPTTRTVYIVGGWKDEMLQELPLYCEDWLKNEYFLDEFEPFTFRSIIFHNSKNEKLVVLFNDNIWSSYDICINVSDEIN